MGIYERERAVVENVRRMERWANIEKAAREMLEAVIEDAGDGADLPNDEGGVALFGDGTESAVTFRHIRNLQAALARPAQQDKE